MLQVIQTKSISILETLVNTLEQYEDLQKRPRYFSKSQDQEPRDEKAADQPKEKDDEHDHGDAVAPSEKFRELSLELLDIGLYTGQKGFEKIQKTKPYELSDQYLHYDERYKELK